MWNIVANNYLEYGVKIFVADSEDDKPSVPISSSRIGSMLFVIENSKTYMLNGNKEWKEINNSAISGIYNSGGSISSSINSSSSSLSNKDKDYTVVDGGTAAS